MSSGRKRKAQVTSFNSGVGTLGWDLGVRRGSQAWGVGLKGTQASDTGRGPGSVVPKAPQKGLLSLQDPPVPGALCLTLLTPGRDAKAPCPGAFPRHPACQAPAEMREAPSPPGPAFPAPHKSLHPANWGDWTPQASMQVPTLKPSVGGGLPGCRA